MQSRITLFKIVTDSLMRREDGVIYFRKTANKAFSTIFNKGPNKDYTISNFSKVYINRLIKYRDWNIRVCGKGSNSFGRTIGATFEKYSNQAVFMSTFAFQS